ncbi:MAG TPA: hypothetical protein VFU02_16715, partial [Polyangiaceae bacterium]|nr:hypothetical protein [Polyangiaceae bacterium]
MSCPDLLFAPGSTRTVDGAFTCADEWRALACDLTTPECATSGTLADGEACVSGIQCASRRCSGNAASCGSCVPSADRGEACDDTIGPQCAPGLQCHGTDSVCVLATEPSVGGQEIGEECDPTASGCYPHECSGDETGAYRCRPYPT